VDSVKFGVISPNIPMQVPIQFVLRIDDYRLRKDSQDRVAETRGFDTSFGRRLQRQKSNGLLRQSATADLYNVLYYVRDGTTPG